MISTREKVFNYAFLTLLAAAVLFPVIWTLGVAVSPEITGSLDLGHMQWSNFTDAWQQAGLTQYLKSSLIITGTAVAISTALAILSGYAFGVLGVVGEKLLFPLMLFGIMIPLEAIVVPLYYDFQSQGLTDTYQGIILAHVGTGVSFGAFWMRAAFRTVPSSIGESAQVDGAGTWTALWRIYLPISRPAIVTFVLLNFMWTWNDYFLSLILVSDPAHQPMTLGLGAFSGRYLVHVNLLAAAAVLISVPVVGLYVFCQRQFIRGMLSGAVKG
ncbi:carbohydrate ABC transporter permease [Stenotrophomonas sp. NPDC087984]|uniref:carbohydrate ABC transporter permease n=1 Tax=Streptomyces violaceusniger TaxID=68280 RepID=UPI000996B1F3|nr:carbohydrate ABC transporter permease [Streptomyces hygroscopicus]AQW56281.1 sugar ABC transporter permease [Streptomyces hygroscopicus]